MDRKVWGLVNQRGTSAAPLPVGMAKHFQGLMFNARSDTLYQKPSFGRLASQGKSCIIALDGFFEWKEAVGTRKKQPYFVRRKTEDSSYLLMAGLWNSVPTGWKDSPTLDTFTIITTEVCQPLTWLHSRMPVCVWDETLAQQWLDQPTEKLHTLLDTRARETPRDVLDWFPVSTEMSSTKFRSADAIKPLPKEKSVKDYFLSMGTASAIQSSSTTKTKENTPTRSKTRTQSNRTPTTATKSPTRKRASESSPTSTSKRAKPTVPKTKGAIDSFFQPIKSSKETT